MRAALTSPHPVGLSEAPHFFSSARFAFPPFSKKLNSHSSSRHISSRSYILLASQPQSALHLASHAPYSLLLPHDSPVYRHRAYPHRRCVDIHLHGTIRRESKRGQRLIIGVYPFLTPFRNAMLTRPLAVKWLHNFQFSTFNFQLLRHPIVINEENIVIKVSIVF